MKRTTRLGCAALIVASLASALLLWVLANGPATLDLGEAPDLLAGRQLAALRDDPGRCRSLLDRAGVRYERVTPLLAGPSCGYAAAVRFVPGGSRGIVLAPKEPPLACPVAAAMAMWEWSVVQPAARRYLGAPVVGIDHLGSYNCRKIAGSPHWSEHSTAEALDVAAFTLADGRRISVLADWHGRGPAATFLRHVRTGACKVFATVLSPDYNDAHRDHLHLDQAARGAMGWRSCR